MTPSVHGAQNRNPADVLVEQASALLEMNRASDALPLLWQALSFGPDDAYVLCKIAFTHSRLSNYHETLTWADKAVAQEPENEWAHRLRAHALWGLGKLKEALRAAQEAQRLAPREPQVYQTLTSLYITQSKWKEAQAAAHQLQTLAPDQAETFLTLARVASAYAPQSGARKMRGVWKEAEHYARESLRLAPDSDEAMSVLARTLEAQGRHEDALSLFYAAAKLNPADTSLKNLSLSLYRRFYLWFALLIGVFVWAFELGTYRAGLPLWPALILGVPVGAALARALIVRFRVPLLIRQRRFIKLPNEMQNTLRQLMQSRWQHVGDAVTTTAALIAAVPALMLGMLHARYSQDYDTLVRGMESTFHPGMVAREQSKHPMRRTITPWQIEVNAVATNALTPSVADKLATGSFSPLSRSEWEQMAALPGQKAVIVTVTVKNEADTRWGFLYNAHLSDARGIQVSKTITPTGYGNDLQVFAGGSTQTGHFTFVVEEKARPITLEVVNPANAERVQWTLPL